MDTRDVDVLYAYNRWANACVLRAVGALDPEQLRRDLGTSYGSVLGTIAHIVWGEWRWLARWQGLGGPLGTDPRSCPNLSSLRQQWMVVARAQRAFLRTLDLAALARPMTYENPPGVRWTYPLGEMLRHVVNHSTYHRGQVTTLLRQLRATAVPTDYLVFLDEGAPDTDLGMDV